MQTLPADRRLRKRPQPATRCGRGAREQTPPRSARTPADGFLSHTFLPKFCESAELPDADTAPAILRSAERVYDYYGLEAMDVRGYAYPYNILLSLWDIDRRTRVAGRYRELQVRQDDDLSIAVSVRESIDTGRTLFYIPLAPLYRALKDEGNIAAKLLLGVCTYLHGKAGVPHYRNSDGYVCYLYDIMDNWIEDDHDLMDDSDYSEQRGIVDEAFRIGDEMAPLLSDHRLLESLPDWYNSFVPQSPFERTCHLLAGEALSLYAEFPNANIYQHTVDKADEDDDDYGYGEIRINEYVSFIGETSSCVYEQMMSMANEDFNERSGVQDFEVTAKFGEACGIYTNELRYEERVITLITKLCNLTDEMP